MIMEKIRRYYVLFKGKVQGVGFRYELLRTAKRNNVTGKVKNLPDGDVESYMQGKKSDILMTIKEVANSAWIRIDDYYMKEVECIPDEDDFTVYY